MANEYKALLAFLPDLVLILLLTLRPTSIWRPAGFGLYTCIAAFLPLILATDDGLQDYLNGCTLSRNFFTGCYLFWFADPLNDFRHESDVVPPRDLPFAKRLYWATCLTYSLRGIGWNHQISNIPPRPTQDRRAFIRKTLLRVLICVLLADLAQSYIILNPMFSPNYTGSFSPVSQGFLLYFLSLLSFATGSSAVIIGAYSLMAVVSVAAGISEPPAWPDLFGSVAEAYTLRRFWGYTWHQTFRRFVVGIGKPLARSLNFESGSLVSAYIQLYTGFIISGLIHTAGDAMVGKNHIGRSFPFFFVQAVAITFEDAVIALAQRTSLVFHSPLLARLFGLSWVVLWFSILMPSFMEWCVALGLTQAELFPFSPARMLVRELNVKYGIDLLSAAGFNSTH